MTDYSECNCEACGYSLTTPEEDGMGAISSVIHPPQNVPPTISQEGKSQEGQMNTPYRFHDKSLLEYEESYHYERKVREQTERDARDHKRLQVEKIALIIGVLGFIGLFYTFRETRRQADIATATLRSQRPYVAPGRKDGTLVEYVPPVPGKEKGAMLVYFQNSGATPALSFLANVHSEVPRSSKPERHIQRWRYVDRKGRIIAWPAFQSATVGADSVQVVIVEPKYVPSADEWEQINAGTWREAFSLNGNFEYCDQWGTPYCERFALHYNPPPIGRFVALTYQCPVQYPYPPNKNDIAETEDQRVEILPPCEQLGERQAEKERVRKEAAERQNDNKK